MTNYDERAHEFLQLLKEVYNSDVMTEFNLFAHGEMLILVHLANHKDEKSQPSEIGKETGLSPARVAAILNALERKNYIKREIDLTDRRRILVQITQTGVEKANLELDIAHRRMIKIFEHMEEAQVEALLSSLKAFHETAKQIDFEKEKE